MFPDLREDASVREEIWQAKGSGDPDWCLHPKLLMSSGVSDRPVAVMATQPTPQTEQEKKVSEQGQQRLNSPLKTKKPSRLTRWLEFSMSQSTNRRQNKQTHCTFF